jgi:hypothetical protein
VGSRGAFPHVPEAPAVVSATKAVEARSA